MLRAYSEAASEVMRLRLQPQRDRRGHVDTWPPLVEVAALYAPISDMRLELSMTRRGEDEGRGPRAERGT